LDGRPTAWGKPWNNLTFAKNSAAKGLAKSFSFETAVLGERAPRLQKNNTAINLEAQDELRDLVQEKLQRNVTQTDITYVVDDDSSANPAQRFIARVDIPCLKGRPSMIGIAQPTKRKAMLSAANKAKKDPVLQVLLAHEPRQRMAKYVDRLKSRQLTQDTQVHGMKFERKVSRRNESVVFARVELATVGHGKFKAAGEDAEPDSWLKAKDSAVESLLEREEVKRWFRNALKFESENYA